VVSAVSQNTFAEIVQGKKVHQLRKNSTAEIHRPFLFAERNWNGYILRKMANASEWDGRPKSDAPSEGENWPHWDFPGKIQIDFG
jgi:hypothetical protein